MLLYFWMPQLYHLTHWCKFMGRVIGSGVHKFKSLFGESVFEHSQTLQLLRASLHDAEREFSISADRRRRRETPAKVLILAEVLGLTAAIVVWRTEGPTELSTLEAFLALCVIAIGVGIIILTYVLLVTRGARETNDLEYRVTHYQSQIQEAMERYLADVIDRFQRLANKRGEVARTLERSCCASLFYCPTHIALADVGIEEVLLINTLDFRDVQIHAHERERRSVSSGVIESAGDRALQGALIGGLAFGSDGMIAGSVVGAAAERKIAIETVETRTVDFVVDIYTRLQHIPVVTIPFGGDERNAKEFYAVVSAALPKGL